MTTAIKRGLAVASDVELVMQTMAQLNRKAAEIMLDFDVSACTDVTGFGLLGHLKEMVCGAGVQATLNQLDVPVLEPVWNYAAAGAIPGGTKNNLEYVGGMVKWSDDVSPLMKLILADAQTSGGLLISLPADQAGEMVKRMKESGVPDAAVIGRISPGDPLIIV